jgi:hypothetical protein
VHNFTVFSATVYVNFLFSYKKWVSRSVFMELCKNDAKLLKREGVFISKKLGGIDFEIGNEMLVALRNCILERRNKDMVSLKRFLQS